MASYWRNLAELTRPKIQELGAIGVVSGIIWLVGLWVWFDWMTGAYAEGVEQAGMYLGLALIVWFLLGVVVYLWRDPHSVRESMMTL